MKHLLTTALVAITTTVALGAIGENPSAHRIASIQGDGTTLYGEVTYSEAMDNDGNGLQWGLYSFNAGKPITMSPLTMHSTLCANGGGTYRKGKLYFTSYYQEYTGALGYLYFVEMDLSDYSIERHALVADTYESIAADMTYDPVGDKIYGVAFDPTDTDFLTYVLVDYNLTTGYPTIISTIDRMSGLACDNMGQMWGIRYSDGKLVKINKQNGEITEVVGDTGVNPIYNGSACFDFETGKLYWTTDERTTDKSGLYQVDITTGEASIISNFPDNEIVAALYIPRADDITLLNPVTDLSADFDTNTFEGSISFTAPSTTVAGDPISGDVTITGYLDSVLDFTMNVAPGAKASVEKTLAQGSHSIEIVATHPTAGKSERVHLDFYVGADGPSAVANLKAVKKSDTKIELSWDAPTEGEHGGYINPALTYYKIVRLPDNKVITEEATGTSYTDNIPAGLMRRYSYQVIGYYRNLMGATATSEEVEMGTAASLPYMQSFDTRADYDTFAVFDYNPDATRPSNGVWSWKESMKCAAYTYHTLLPGDDWLITPGFSLLAGRTYHLSFGTVAEGGTYPESLEVKIGKGYAVESMSQTIMPRTDIVTPIGYDFATHEFVFSVPEDGNYYIGFHAVSVKGQYTLYLDDIALENGVSLAAPGEVTALSVKPGDKADEINVSFQAPATDLYGNALTSLSEVKVMRDGSEIKSFAAADGLEIGSAINFVDTNVPIGKHEYSVVSYNENGAGNPTVVSVFAGLDTPTAVTAVTHTSADGVNASLSWTAPTVGVNGGSLAYEPLTYTVTDKNGKVLAEGLTDSSFTEAIDTTEGQNSVYYNVRAVNSCGSSDEETSDFITYGKAYSNQYAESFAGGAPSTRDWTMRVLVPSPYDNGFYGRYFSFGHNPNDWDRGPKPDPQDNDGGMLVAYTDYLDVEARMISPKINVSGLTNPILSFWFYHYYNADTENGYSTEKETMTVEALVNGEYKALTEKPILLINGNGWYRYDIPLKDAVGVNDFQIAFCTHNYISYDMHVDNITIHDTPDYDMMIESISIPDKIAVNSSRNLEITLFNNGVVPADDYYVEVYRDDEVIGEIRPTEPLNFGESITYKFVVTPDITLSNKRVNYSARVFFANDENESNNGSEVVSVDIVGSDVPPATDLSGTLTDGKVYLNWHEPVFPDGGYTTDGFEKYTPFTISDFGDWQLVDNDNSLTYTISNSSTESGDYEYDNAGYQMAFQIFNPSMINMKGNLWTPYLGEQMAVCFDAVECSNDDWLISPKVIGGSKVSFMARSVVDYYGLEKFNFCYTSEEADAPSTEDFTCLEQVKAVPASDWTRYEFTLPDDATRFAINCVSEDSYALLIDEVSYQSEECELYTLLGYNVYRDGVKINDALVPETNYVDTTPSSTENHVYNVTAVCEEGESVLSEGVTVWLNSVEKVDRDALRIKTGAGYLDILYANREVTVCDVNGIALFHDMVGDYARISLQPGLYLVKAGNKVIKTIIR